MHIVEKLPIQEWPEHYGGAIYYKIDGEIYGNASYNESLLFMINQKGNKCCLLNPDGNQVVMTYNSSDDQIHFMGTTETYWSFYTKSPTNPKRYLIHLYDSKKKEFIMKDYLVEGKFSEVFGIQGMGKYHNTGSAKPLFSRDIILWGKAPDGTYHFFDSGYNKKLSDGYNLIRKPAKDKDGEYLILHSGPYQMLYQRGKGIILKEIYINCFEKHRIINISFLSTTENKPNPNRNVYGNHEYLLLVTVEISKKRKKETYLCFLHPIPSYKNNGPEYRVLRNTQADNIKALHKEKRPTSFVLKRGKNQIVMGIGGIIIFEYECDELVALYDNIYEERYYKFRKNNKWGILYYSYHSSKIIIIEEAKYDNISPINHKKEDSDSKVILKNGPEIGYLSLKRDQHAKGNEPQFKRSYQKVATIPADRKIKANISDESHIVYKTTNHEIGEKRFGIIERASTTKETMNNMTVSFIDSGPIYKKITRYSGKKYGNSVFYIVTLENGKMQVVGNQTITTLVNNVSGTTEYDKIEVRGASLTFFNKSSSLSNYGDTYIYNFSSSQARTSKTNKKQVEISKTNEKKVTDELTMTDIPYRFKYNGKNGIRHLENNPFLPSRISKILKKN